MTTEAGAVGYAPIVSIGISEQAKYERMWQHEQYRAVAPGESIAIEFLKQAGFRAGADVIDFGAGTGRGALMIALLGKARVHMLDFAANALDPEVRQALTTQAHALSFTQHDLNKPAPVSAEYGYCFPAGTPVAGSGKTIDELAVGDTVLNAEGKLQKVLKTFKRNYTGGVVSLGIDCLGPIEMTDEHPVRVSAVRRVHRGNASEGKKAAYEWVAAEPEWKAAKDVVVGDWVQIPRAAVGAAPRLQFKHRWEVRDVALDEGSAWLLGLYVAEGHVGRSNDAGRPSRITLSLGSTERDLAERAVAEFHRLGVSNARISEPPSIKAGNALHVVADSADLAEKLAGWCGVGAHGKRIPQSIFMADEALLRAFVAGLVDGDGCLRRDLRTQADYFSVATVSKGLASDLTSALVKLGVYCRWSTAEARQSVINARTVTGSETHTVSWSARTWSGANDASGRVPYGRMKFLGGAAYARVSEVSTRRVRGLPVFNVHTEDETYGVPFTVHNCTDVMEHIPPEEVDRVLGNILHAAQHVFFQISCEDDVCGALIGQPLHLSVHPYAWWLAKLQSMDCVIHWSVDHGSHCCFYVTAWQQGSDFIDKGILNTDEAILIENVKKNVAGGWKTVEPYSANDVEVQILCGGPSLNQFEDEIIANRAAGIKVVTTNGTYQWAIERGLTPLNQIVVDGRAFNARFTHPVVEGCNYFIASQVDPSVLEGLPKDRTWLWHTNVGKIKDILDDQYPVWFNTPGGSTVTLRAIPLLRMLGFKRFHLYGFDSCLDGEAHHAYPQTENDDTMVMPVTCGGRIFHCHPWMCSQAQEFQDLIKFLGDEIEVRVAGDGLIAHILNTGAKMYDEDQANAA